MSDFSPAQIRSVYIDLCKNPAYSINLRIPTDARIKRACVDLYKKKNTLSDKQVLINFIQLPDDIDVGIALKKVNADKFKSVVKFLKNKTKEPRDETIELVAWLINFKFEAEKPEVDLLPDKIEPELKPHENKGSNKENGGIELEVNPVSNSKEDINTQSHSIEPIIANPSKVQYTFLNILAIVCLFLLLEAGTMFLWRNYTDHIAVPSADEKCMYWVGTHYEPIKCGELKDGTPVVPLDVKKLNTLKKIYLSDTLTEKSIGHVWYSNVGKKHEFFTDSGMHPVDTVKRLRPLTAYILTKHTSNHRFLVKVITMASCSIVVAVLLAFGCVYLRRKLKRKLPVKTD